MEVSVRGKDLAEPLNLYFGPKINGRTTKERGSFKKYELL